MCFCNVPSHAFLMDSALSPWNCSAWSVFVKFISDPHEIMFYRLVKFCPDWAANVQNFGKVVSELVFWNTCTSILHFTFTALFVVQCRTKVKHHVQSMPSNRFDMYIFWFFFKPKLYMTWKRIFQGFKRAIARTKQWSLLVARATERKKITCFKKLPI